MRDRGLLLCLHVPPAVAYLGEGGLGSGCLGNQKLNARHRCYTYRTTLEKYVSVFTTPEYAHKPVTQQFPSWARARAGTTRNTWDVDSSTDTHGRLDSSWEAGAAQRAVPDSGTHSSRTDLNTVMCRVAERKDVSCMIPLICKA